MGPESLDLRKLRTFHMVVRHGGLRVAAARLNLTVPAVSLQIRKLEEDLGVTLFKRLPNRLVLTLEGEGFLKEAEGIFERVESALRTLSTTAETTGRMTLAMGNDFAWYVAPRLSDFIKRYPGVELSVQIGRAAEVIADLERGRLDIGIGVFSELPRDIEKEVVTETGLSLACIVGHPLLVGRPPSLAEIARHRILAAPRHTQTREQIDRVFTDVGIETRTRIEAGNCQTALAFAERNIGVAIVHTLCAGAEAKSSLRYLDLSHLFGKVEITAVYRRGTTPALRGLLDALTTR